MSASVIPIIVNIELEAEQEIAPLFQTYLKRCEDRKHAGEQLGRSLLRWRDEYKAQGSHGGDGFKALLARLNIPRATAYRLIRRVDPNLVSSETKEEIKLKLTVAGLTRWAERLPDKPGKGLEAQTLTQLRNVRTKLDRVLAGIEANAVYIRRAEAEPPMNCAGLPYRHRGRMTATVTSPPQNERALREISRAKEHAEGAKKI